MTLFVVLVGAGLIGGVVVAGLVTRDHVRRGIPLASGLLWGLAWGMGSLGSFLVPYVFSGQLRYMYFQVIRPQPIAGSPQEWLIVSLLTGSLLSSLLVVLYYAGRRLEGSDRGMSH